jgi:hypothetical protein
MKNHCVIQKLEFGVSLMRGGDWAPYYFTKLKLQTLRVWYQIGHLDDERK